MFKSVTSVYVPCLLYRFDFLKCDLFWRNVYRTVRHSQFQKFVTRCCSSRRGKKGLTFLIFTVLDQSFSEMRFHVRSLVQSCHICRVLDWKVYFAAIDVKFYDQSIEKCPLLPVLSNNLKIFSLFFPCTVQTWLSFPGVKFSCQIFMHFRILFLYYSLYGMRTRLK